MEDQILLIEKLIKGCLKRQRKSQKGLYKMFYGYGMSITLRYADSREEAVTIFNDAFMKVFDNIQKYDSTRPFKPWLRRIIINTAINYFHKNKIRWETLEEMNVHTSTQETIISGISYGEIIELMQLLSPAYRTVFNLHVIEGFKHKEIAEKLGISEGTSKSNLSKAKRKLQSLLEKNLMER